MPAPAKLPGKPSRQFVHLQVGFNEAHCKAPNYVRKLHNQWLRVQVATIIGFVTAHFEDAPIHPDQKSNEAEVRLRQAWSALCDFDPRGEDDGDRVRLVVSGGDNSDVRSGMSQLLGVGLGLAVICKGLDISFASVRKVNFSPKKRHDFDAERHGKPVKIEVRGRFRKKGRAKAIKQVKSKFKRKHDFAQVVAAQVYPFDRAKRDAVDVELLDPEGGLPSPPEERIRRIIDHYNSYFEQQNVDAQYLLRLLTQVPDQEFLRFFRTTWRRLWRSQLEDTAQAGVTTMGRTSLRLGQDVYFGTVWEGRAASGWVQPLIPDADQGWVFMGLWRGVLDAFLTEDRTLALLHLDAEGASSTDDGVAYVRLSDGFLVAWSRDLRLLLEHP